MTIGVPPVKSNLPVSDERTKWTQPWAAWFNELFLSVFGWSRTFTASLTYDFGSIATLSQATTTVTVTGAAVNDSVIVTPASAVNGIIIDGTVTSANTVTIRAVNYSSGAIDPGSKAYRVIVFQQ